MYKNIWWQHMFEANKCLLFYLWWVCVLLIFIVDIQYTKLGTKQTMVVMSTLTCYVKNISTSFSTRYIAQIYIYLLMCPITSLTELEWCIFSSCKDIDSPCGGKIIQLMSSIWNGTFELSLHYTIFQMLNICVIRICFNKFFDSLLFNLHYLP